MRKPRVENKYNLKPKDIEKAIVLDRERLMQPPFWRNDVIGAWCITGGAGKGLFNMYIDSYWFGFHDDNARVFPGKARLSCSCHEDMCDYIFQDFFNEKEMENEVDLELQENLLEQINWLIDEKIIEIPKDIETTKK